jgi:dipeptidase
LQKKIEITHDINFFCSDMKKTVFFMILGLVSGFLYIQKASACTNLIVTKGATKDGSTMVSYLADSHSLYGELYFKPAADYKAGTMVKVYEWDTGKYLGQIVQAQHTYSVVGNMNEHQLVIGETTFTGREELQDTTAIIDYGSLIYLTLQRAKTAREAIQVIGKLVEQYGYYSTGESFSIADANEAWIFEIIGKGINMVSTGKGKTKVMVNANKGAVWVARRIPDGYISGHANQSRIRQFPLNDPENCIYSKDVISFARSKGWFSGKDENFSFADTYAPLTYEALRFCEGRVYSMFNRAAPSLHLSMDYVKGLEGAEPMPLWIKPDSKLSTKDVMELMRDHFEGTDFDMTKDFGAGPYALPYRWRPLTWKVDGVEYGNERAISTQQTGFSFVAQCRSWMPDPIGGIFWFGVDDTYSTVFTPMYCGMTRVPNAYAEGNGDLWHYTPNSAFWVFNTVANFAYSRYSDMIQDIRARQSEIEGKYIATTPSIDKTALDLYKTDPKLAIQYITEYSVAQGTSTVEEWKKLFGELMVKYMDGNVKVNGKITHPEYPEWWKRKIAEDTKDRLKTKKMKSELENKH